MDITLSLYSLVITELKKQYNAEKNKRALKALLRRFETFVEEP